MQDASSFELYITLKVISLPNWGTLYGNIIIIIKSGLL